MNCKHTETTAVLAAFGEAPPEFEAHLRECTACLNVVRQHTATLAAIEPILQEVKVPSRRWRLPAIGFLVAAGGLLALQFSAPSSVVPHPSTQTLTMEVDLFDDPIDETLSSIELEIELFHLEET